MTKAGASEALSDAAMAALRRVPGLNAVHEPGPIQAMVPHAIVDAGAETDWGCKDRIGREVRLTVTIHDEGERPARLRRLISEAEAALGAVAPSGWELVTMRLLGSRIARDRSGWRGAIDCRARMLSD